MCRWFRTQKDLEEAQEEIEKILVSHEKALHDIVAAHGKYGRRSTDLGGFWDRVSRPDLDTHIPQRV